jgi:hypothetical protein
MECSREISSFMYLHFSFSYEYGEELNNSIVVCVYALFSNAFLCLNLNMVSEKD